MLGVRRVSVTEAAPANVNVDGIHARTNDGIESNRRGAEAACACYRSQVTILTLHQARPYGSFSVGVGSRSMSLGRSGSFLTAL